MVVPTKETVGHNKLYSDSMIRIRYPSAAYEPRWFSFSPTGLDNTGSKMNLTRQLSISKRINEASSSAKY
jgi:hypothetical protein